MIVVQTTRDERSRFWSALVRSEIAIAATAGALGPAVATGDIQPNN